MNNETRKHKEINVAVDGKRQDRNYDAFPARVVAGPGARATRNALGVAALAMGAALIVMLSFVLGITASSVQAQGLSIQPGPLASFEIAAPGAVRAGERVTITVVARDAAGNIVTNYAQVGGGVSFAVLPATGVAAGVDPSRFAASQFVDGVLRADVLFTRAGALELEVQDASLRVRARSGRIESRPGAAAEVRVLGPREARVGEAFELTIELFDRFGNALVDYDRSGAEVALSQGVAGGAGVFEPSRISPSLFSQGRATVRIRATQAENAIVVADAGGVRGRSAEFPVRAGALHGYKVVAPGRQVAAGEPFSVAVEAVDALGNTIADYDRNGVVVNLKTTGLGTLEPATIPPTAFREGVAIVSLRATQAERIGIIAQDATGAKRGESAERVEIVGGRLGRFDVLPAENARAGVPLAIQVVGYDVYGNMVRNYGDRPIRIAIASADASPLEVSPIAASSFRDGVAMTTVTPVKAGTLVVQVIDEISGAGGRGTAVRVRSGVIASYGVRAPQASAAHEPFEVEITALDRFSNIVEDYDRVGAGVLVEHGGAGPLSPAAIAASAFQNGVARVRFTATTAEELTLALVQQGGTARGRSTPILITHAEARRFKVVAPARVVAGQPARVILTVLDDYENPVVGFGALGRTVTLYTENGDPVAPPQVPAAAFRRGVAEVDVTFFRSGDVVIVAEELTGRVSGKSAGLRVVPGAPAQLVVAAPERGEAGQPLGLRVEMRDRMGNRIRDYSPGAASLSLKALGAGNVLAQGVMIGDIRNMVFREGVAELSVLPQRAETIRFEVSDEIAGVRGSSGAVVIAAGPADRFTVENLVSGVLQAGTPIRLRLTALDVYGNVASTFGRDGAGVRLLPDAGTTRAGAAGVFVPSTVSGVAFRDGRAELYAVYDRAERVEVAVERLAAGLIIRPEVVAVLAEERAGGAIISVLGNAPLERGDAVRLGDALFELRVRGAVLASNSLRVTRQAGIVSLVTLAQEDDGVRVLIHTAAPAVLRAGDDANRIVIDVDPVMASGSLRGPVLVPQGPSVPVFGAATSAPAGPSGALPTMADIDRLVRENRFSEALGLVNILVQTRPNDPALLSLRRRLETLSSVVRPAAPGSQALTPPLQPAPVPVAPAASQVEPLQPVTQPIENVSNPSSSGVSAAEEAVRAGRYREAVVILDRHLAANPGDAAAVRMKQRIEQMIRILEERPAGGGR